MPIYEYTCRDCGQKFEALRSIKDADTPIECSKCNSNNTTREISVFFACGGGRALSPLSGGCGSCKSGSCASCHH